MKNIRAEIAQQMTGFESAESRASARFLFPDGFTGFQGHFPEQKILPGVCQIQCALVTVEKALNRKISLKEVVLAKYFAPVGPGEEVLCDCRDFAGNGEFTFRAFMTRGAARISELKLRVR